MKRLLVIILSFAVSLSAEASLPLLTQEPIDNATHVQGAEKGGIIPGLKQGAIPQGLAYDNDSSLLMLTHYFPGDAPSCISILDVSSSELLVVKWLRSPDRDFINGHVGGISTDGNYLWVSSGGSVYKFLKADILDRNQKMDVEALSQFPVETRASYCTYYNGLLFVGEFANYSFPYIYRIWRPTDPSHHQKDQKGRKKYAWICAYDSKSDMKTPVRVLSVRQKVQGIAITDDYIFLSISYGQRKNSKLAIYRNPFSEPPHRHVESESGEQVPLWFLDESSWLKTISLLPMTEGIAVVDGKLAVLYESAAEKYRDDTPAPVDRILYYDYKQWLKQEEPD
jgi:hypothetical protein